MATTIVTKKGSGAPAASDLVEGELAVDTTHGRLYTENSSAAVVELGSNPSGNITFGDNGKAIFGAGSDLQIYHDGSNSYIKDSGTGDLLIEGSDNIWLMKAGGSEVFLNTADDGAVTLYHNNAAKLATTSTGIDVTGVITTDGLTTSADINFGDSDKAVFGAGSDLQIYHDGTHSYIEDAGTGAIKIKVGDFRVENASGYNLIKGVGDIATLHHAGSEKLATTSTGIQVTGNIANVSGNLTLDVAGEIILDADGTGTIRFNDGGTNFGMVFGDNSNFTLISKVQDKDMIFQGNDGGSNITALTLNMSEAGEASFNSDILLKDTKVARFGDDQDFRISFDSHGIIQNVTSDSDILFKGNDGGSTITALSLDMSAAGAATFNSSVTIPTIAYVGTSIVHQGDTDTSIDFATDTMTHYTGGLRALDLGATFTVFNTNGADVDFRVESSGNANMLFVDGGNDRVGIGHASPTAPIDVRRADASGKIAEFHTSTGYGLEFGSSQAQAYIEAGHLQTLLMTVPSDMTIDAGGDIILDADSGAWRFKDGGGSIIELSVGSGSSPTFYSAVSNADIVFKGNDGGSAITALTLDMSEAGAATFNSSVTSAGQIKVAASAAHTVAFSVGDVGTGWYNTGSNSIGLATAGTQRLIFNSAGAATFNSSVTAQTLTATNGTLYLDDDGSHNGIINVPATLYLNLDSDANSTGEAFILAKDRTSTSGGTELFRVQEDGTVKVLDRLLVNGATSNAQLSVVGDASLRAQNVQVAVDGHTAIGFFNAAGTDVGGIGINAGGASISLGGNAVANTLDDYEEGTWTPTFRDISGNLATLSTASGSYTKIGRQVIINFTVTISSKGSMTGNYCLMGNLPFSHPNNQYNGTGHIDYFSNFDTAVSRLAFDTSSTGTLMWLVGVAAAGSVSSQYIPTSYIGGNEHFKGTCIYYTDD